MKNYAQSLKSTQKQPIFGRTDMVENNAGGYVFKINPTQQLERFLLCGTENGSYYAGEMKLTQDNAKAIIVFIQQDGQKVLNTVLALQNRVPKKDTILFVLALLCTYGNEEVKKATYNEISKVCKTATHLFMFVSQVNAMRGWSRGLRRAVAKWYESKDLESLAYQVVKYRNRTGFTHKDILRLSHPVSKSVNQNNLFKYAVEKFDFENLKMDGIFGSSKANNMVLAFEKAKTASTKELVSLINESNLTWEMVPTEKLNEPEVLKALLLNMPAQALVRNLNRFAKAGLTNGNSETTKAIAEKLKFVLPESNIHPVNLVNQMLTYSVGQGDKSSNTWNVNQKIVDTLHEGYYDLVKNVEATGKNILMGLDVSGSMNSRVAGTQINASNLGALLSATILRTEPNSEVMAFDTQIKKVDFGARTDLNAILRANFQGGGTDCSLPFEYALQTKNKYDAIIIFTDSETWAGQSHALDLIKKYRKINPNVKVIEVAMVANPHTLLPEDPNFLRIVGFDASVMSVINTFIS
jgi:60 kDa SS-A/Ro ribonucleoprotein